MHFINFSDCSIKESPSDCSIRVFKTTRIEGDFKKTLYLPLKCFTKVLVIYLSIYSFNTSLEYKTQYNDRNHIAPAI